jgi:hypothetical protein
MSKLDRIADVAFTVTLILICVALIAFAVAFAVMGL